MNKKLLQFEEDLQNLSHKGMRKSIDAITLALKDVGDPQKKYPIIHIAGTNGKGSTCTFIAQLLAQNSYRVGLALSPHVVTYRERIQKFFNFETGLGEYILEDELLSLHFELKKKNESFWDLTYYEYFLFLALMFFEKQKMDFVVLETGLGGRLDATNVCDSVLSAITSVGYDHMNILGDTLDKILIEKIQIAKSNTDFIFAPEDKNLVQIAKDYCRQKNIRFYKVKDFAARAEIKKNNFPDVLVKNLNLSFTALSVLKEKGYRFDLEKSYQLNPPPARFEILQSHPDILLDAAHNEDALKALKQFVLKKYGQDYDLVFGCLQDRDLEKLAYQIIPKNGAVYWLNFAADGRETPIAVYEKVKDTLGGKIYSFNNELNEALKKRSSKRPLVVCGSFYLCGQFKKFFQEKFL